jgi:hypothetical protein
MEKMSVKTKPKLLFVFTDLETVCSRRSAYAVVQILD